MSQPSPNRRTPLLTDDDIWIRASSLQFENEAAVETRLIVPLLRSLGYSEADHIVPKYPVIFQEGRQGRRPEADFVVFAERPHSRATSLVTIEAKHPREELSGGKEQGESYAANVRSPLLMMSNGRRIQLWQYQPTYESELVLDCSVAELLARRGEVEALLAKEAVLAFAKSMRHKSFGLLSRNLGAYERAEFERRDGVGVVIPRRLKDTGASSGEVISTNLLAKYPMGAALLAASGYGKTTLARELRLQALERRWSGECSRLPIEVFLPDVLPSQGSLEAFLCARVVAHCPQVSPSAFRDRLREDGIVLLGDGFDRVLVEHQPKVEGALATFQRDFPKTQIFLFTRAVSRPERLPLPSVRLMELNDDEQRDLVEHFALIEGYAGRLIWHRVPEVLRTVCRHPLILQLTLAFYKEQGRLPTRIDTLFQAWLERLVPSSLQLARRTDLRRLLTSFANATVDGPLTEAASVGLARKEGFSDDLLQLLLNADALAQRGGTIELQHEALADYLRALDVVRLSAAEASQRLKALPLREGSQLPALLMATANNAEMQRLVWAKIASADITAAMGALRYRADIASDLNALALSEVSRRYLSEIVEGITLPLEIHFPSLAARIRFDLVGSETKCLGIVGAVQPKSGQLGYSFVARSPDEDQITVGQADNARLYFGKSLFKMGLRLDSGRLVGMSHVREGLLKLVKERRIDGGTIWTEERTLGRLRHLVNEYQLAYTPGMSLDGVRELLVPNAGRLVGAGAFRPGQTFAVDDLVADIDFLVSQGQTHLDPWWTRADFLNLDAIEGQLCLGNLLDLYHRRTQLAYREIVEANFSLLAGKLRFNQIMPLRYEIEVERHYRRGYASWTLHWRWVPVSTFDEAGATITFPAKPSEMWSKAAFDAYRRRIDEALARLGRSAPDRQYTCGRKGILDLMNNSPMNGDKVDETATLCTTAGHIIEDIEHLFFELPTSES